MLGQPDSSPSLHLHLSRWREGAGWEMPLCWLVSLKICYHRQRAISHFYGKLSFPLSERDHFSFSRVLSVLQHVLPSFIPAEDIASPFTEKTEAIRREQLYLPPRISPRLSVPSPLLMSYANSLRDETTSPLFADPPKPILSFLPENFACAVTSSPFCTINFHPLQRLFSSAYKCVISLRLNKPSLSSSPL